MAGDGVVTRLNALPQNHMAHVLGVAKEYGYDLVPILRQAGLGDALDSRDLSGDIYHLAMEKILNLVEIPAFGVRVGQKFSLVDYGVLGYASISSPTLRHLLETFFRFQQIVGSSATFWEALRVEDNKAMIEVHSTCITDQLVHFDVEEAIGQWTTASKEFFRETGTMFTRINLAYARPDYAHDMESLLGCPVYYGKERNEMVFPATRLDEPIAMANELTAQLCEQQCNTILRNLTMQQGLVDQVRKLIINTPGRVPLPEDIAAQLHMSYRTLRRKLQEEGTSFKEIHNEVRMGMAAEYMRQTDLTTQEISVLLGYSEASNFHRAFRAWHEKTPGEYRTDTRSHA